jgi:tetratricopeptide (TPR) repeat protein
MMKNVFKSLVGLLLFIPSLYAQKEQLKEAQKEFKSGNSEQVIAILSPIEYTIINAAVEDKIKFYYLKSNALVNLAGQNGNTFESTMLAVTALNDLIQTEQEFSTFKYTPEAIKTINKIKGDLIKSANENRVTNHFCESGNKFHLAYLLDKKDTLQLYHAAVDYKNGNEDDLALKSYEELKAIKYHGNVTVYSAYNKSTHVEEYFASIEERDVKMKSGLYFKPMQTVKSKKEEIYKSLALLYIKKGFNEKALKCIVLARNLNREDESLAILEANLYLGTKEYDFFDRLATIVIGSKNNNAEVAFNFGISCQNEKYYQGAENYYKRAIEIDPKYVEAYISLSQLLVDKSAAIHLNKSKIGASKSSNIANAELESQKKQLIKVATTYLQKAISIDPFNNTAKQLLSYVNPNANNSTTAIAIEE